jgi:hypothetical protein
MNYVFGEAYFEYFESCDFSCENTNIDVSVFMFDLRMINENISLPSQNMKLGGE